MAVVIKVGETKAVSVDIGEKVYIQGDPGFSPTIEVTDITGGYRLTITDINGDKTVDVMNGLKGDTGATGAQGPKGDKGDTGATGPQGEPGKGLTISGTVATVSALPATAEQGTVYNVGTAAPYTLYMYQTGSGWISLGQLEGPEGPEGPQGPKGDTGDAGPQGPKGDTGDTGPQGPQGETGPAGPAVPLSGATPLMDGTASPGTGTSASRADHVHPTDTTRAAAAELATYVRPNLLDNWYFVGGGSQLGYGIFPINQRGQATYSGSGYTIDRWMRESNDASTVELLSSGLKITRNNGSWCLRQNFKSMAILSGKTVTFSALIADTNSAEFAINLNTYDGSSYESKYSTPATAGQTSLISVTTKLRGGLTDARCILVNNGAVGTYATVIAAKLEIGDTQTLAHQEEGAWVLNEIPDYATELAKCQAYYIKTSAVSEYSCSLGLYGSNPRITIPLPVTMAKAPTFTKSGADGFQFGVGTTRVSVGGSSDSIQISGNYGTVLFPNAVRLTLQTTASIGTAFLPCTVEIPVFELSAE